MLHIIKLIFYQVKNKNDIEYAIYRGQSVDEPLEWALNADDRLNDKVYVDEDDDHREQGCRNLIKGIVWELAHYQFGGGEGECGQNCKGQLNDHKSI